MSLPVLQLSFPCNPCRCEPKPALSFDGDTFEPKRDAKRLGEQFLRVRELVKDGRWRTLREIADAVGASEASVSARLRDLRKEKFGGHEVQRRRVEGGLFAYRAVLP